MKKLSKIKFNEIKSWIYRHARYIDIALWQYQLENGSRNAILNALAVYQNEDGGFGHGIEPDNENPESSPMMIVIAKDYIKLPEDNEHPIVKGIFKYLESGKYCTEKGWLWAIPSNNYYPCRNYFAYPKPHYYPEDAVFYSGDIMINMSLFEFIMDSCDPDSVLYQRALKIADFYMDTLINSKVYISNLSEFDKRMILERYFWYIGDFKKYNLTDRYNVETLYEKLRQLAEENPSDSSNWILEEYRNRNDEKKEETPEQKEKMLDELVNKYENESGLWSKEGLKCDEPEKKHDEVISSSHNMWNYCGVIADIHKLYKNERIE